MDNGVLLQDSAMIEIGYGCNLRCPFCYNKSGIQQPNWMTVDDFQRIACALASSGVKTLHISGGEPLLHPDIMEILGVCDLLAVGYGLVTNGSLLDDATIDCICQSSVASIQISLDGATRSTDEALRGSGHYDAVMHAVQSFHRNDFRRGSLKMTICQQNRHELADFFALCLDNNFRPAFAFALPLGRAKEAAETLCLNEQQRYEVNQIYHRLCLKHQVDDNTQETQSKAHLGGTMHCSLPKVRPLIKSNGDVQPCDLIYDPAFCMGNLLSQDPAEVFTADTENTIFGHIMRVIHTRSKMMTRNMACKACSIRQACGQGCPAMAMCRDGFFEHDGDCLIRKDIFVSKHKNDINNLVMKRRVRK